MGRPARPHAPCMQYDQASWSIGSISYEASAWPGLVWRTRKVFLKTWILLHRCVRVPIKGRRWPPVLVWPNSRGVICLKRIYNFWCSMLIFTPFALCFVTLCGVFMRFPELTYWQDATVSVSCFLLFLCFRKATQEIFSELDETSSWRLILPGSF
jgi:hypothetical protein